MNTVNKGKRVDSASSPPAPRGPHFVSRRDAKQALHPKPNPVALAIETAKAGGVAEPGEQLIAALVFATALECHGARLIESAAIGSYSRGS